MSSVNIQIVSSPKGSSPLFVVYPAGSENLLTDAARQGILPASTAEDLVQGRRMRVSGNIQLPPLGRDPRRRTLALEIARPQSCARKGSAATGPLAAFFLPSSLDERYRQAGAEISTYLRQAELSDSSIVVLTSEGADSIGAFVEGLVLAGYVFDGYLGVKKKPASTRQVALSGNVPVHEITRVVARSGILGEAVAFARDLINTPSNEMGPDELEQAAIKMSRSLRLKTKVLRLVDLNREGMGGILGVGQGSPRAPRLLVLEYSPPKPACRVALVGKGITFDSGGLSLKDAKGMELMKKDMAGGAVCLAVIKAIATLKRPIHLVVFVPVAENMPDGRAQRPGDVLRTSSGKTIEVINTDAEGRLILAEALTYAQRYRPDYLIDIATLTGEAGRTFANVLSPALSNDWGFLGQVIESGLAVHERVWPLPILPEYRDALSGDIADLKNSALVGGYGAGSIIGGSFLSEFVGDVPWVHLDIANTTWSAGDLGYCRKGATGMGVRLLTHLLERLAPLGSRGPRRGRAAGTSQRK